MAGRGAERRVEPHLTKGETRRLETVRSGLVVVEVVVELGLVVVPGCHGQVVPGRRVGRSRCSPETLLVGWSVCHSTLPTPSVDSSSPPPHPR